MFNRKLKEEIERLKEENEEKDRYISLLRKKIDAIEEFESNMPDDCVFGVHFEGCLFVKVFYIPINHNYDAKLYDKIFVCGKSKTCPNFVKKPNVKEEG